VSSPADAADDDPDERPDGDRVEGRNDDRPGDQGRPDGRRAADGERARVVEPREGPGDDGRDDYQGQGGQGASNLSSPPVRSLYPPADPADDASEDAV
jgi:hypothetical protein